MDHAEDGNNNDDVFIYMGGDQEVPRNVTHVRVHKSVKIIRQRAFYWCRQLVSVEMHDGVEIIEQQAFSNCNSLRGIKLIGVKIIGEAAFSHCYALVDVEFGDKLETIEDRAFLCTSLRNINLPKVRAIGEDAFYRCTELTDAKLSEDLERIERGVFNSCRRLRRIAFPLKDNLLENDNVFLIVSIYQQLTLWGGIYKTVSSLLLDSWKNEMKDEIDSINQALPNTPTDYNTDDEKTTEIQQWMRSVLQRIEHFKLEHYTLLKEFTTLLGLALWKAKLDESQNNERSLGTDQPAKKAKIDIDAARQEQRITSGANIVIKNVLPFLKLE